MIDPMMHARLCRQVCMRMYIYTPSMTVFNNIFNISMQLPMHIIKAFSVHSYRQLQAL